MPNLESFAPSYNVAEELPEVLRPLSIDVRRIGENLYFDFPEFEIEDWQRVMIHYTTDLPVGIGGFTTKIAAQRDKSGGRVGDQQREAIGLGEWDHKRIDRISEGRDVVVVVNPIFNMGNNCNGYVWPVRKIDASLVLAHELRHAVDHLNNKGRYRLEESIAMAYMCATAPSWRDIVKIGSEDKDDWFR